MSLDRPYCSMDELRSFISNNNPADEDTLIRAINQASRLVDDKTLRDFWFHSYTTSYYTVKRVDVSGDLALLPFEIITLTEVKLDDELLIEGIEDDYIYEAGSRMLRHISSWGAEPFKGVLKVKGTFGFALDADDPDTMPPPTIPPKIKEATLMIAAAKSGLWTKSRIGISGERESFIETKIPSDAGRLLMQYKLSHRTAF